MSNKPNGCDPCGYLECGCAYSESDPRMADAMSDDASAREIAIRALKFVKVNTKRGFLTDISVAIILVEMERSGIKFRRPCHKPAEG